MIIDGKIYCDYSNICDIISGMENYLYGGDETE